MGSSGFAPSDLRSNPGPPGTEGQAFYRAIRGDGDIEIMPWVRLDDSAPGHPKFQLAGPRSFELFVAGICYCNKYLTDGVIPKSCLRILLPTMDEAIAVEVAGRLANNAMTPSGSPSWIDCGEHYLVHDIERYQPSKAAVEAERQRGKERAAQSYEKRKSSSPEEQAKHLDFFGMSSTDPTQSNPTQEKEQREGMNSSAEETAKIARREAEDSPAPKRRKKTRNQSEQPPPLPAELASVPELESLVEKFGRYRVEEHRKHIPMGPLAWTQFMNKLADCGPKWAKVAILYAMTNQWLTIFPPDQTRGSTWEKWARELGVTNNGSNGSNGNGNGAGPSIYTRVNALLVEVQKRNLLPLAEFKLRHAGYQAARDAGDTAAAGKLEAELRALTERPH